MSSHLTIYEFSVAAVDKLDTFMIQYVPVGEAPIVQIQAEIFQPA